MPISFAVWEWYFCVHIWEDTYDGTAISDAKTDAAVKEWKGKGGKNFELTRCSVKNLKVLSFGCGF